MARAACYSLGIDAHLALVDYLPAAAILNANYDLLIIPQMYGTNFITMINNAGITIPIFILSSRGSFATSNFGNTPGVTATNLTAIADYFVTPSFSSAKYIAFNTATGVLASPGVSLMDVSATSPLTGSAQANAGNTVMWWTTRGSGAGNMYVSLLSGTIHSSLAILIQAAINNGDFTAAQVQSIRKAPVVIDLDHINNDGFYNASDPTDTTNYDTFMSYVPPDGVVWAGMYNGADTDITRLAGSALRTKLINESGKRLRYCWHNHHPVRIQETTGTFPAITNVQTKAQISSNYETDKALWEAQGLTFHYPGYYNNGGFRWNEDTLALASPEISLMSDAANTTAKAGWGFRMFRTSTTSSRALPQSATQRVNIHQFKAQPRGILLVGIKAVNDAALGPYNTIALWRNNMRWLTEAFALGNSILFHDWNFSSPQEPGTGNNHGIEVMNQIRDFRLYLKDTVKFFANPLDYYTGRNFNVGTKQQ